ncbi:uncharacterized protein LOC131683164 [Topomyia yanbarensis]|uniref:uncharacterized protein LOC131683164 n=1 Tax=Topomyia yanbarensis TaxID=2498891 RepID=UPI00273ACB00|nr:uncharacterized protein LOC131683164 [Topomyia yanbarensis]
MKVVCGLVVLSALVALGSALPAVENQPQEIEAVQLEDIAGTPLQQESADRAKRQFGGGFGGGGHIGQGHGGHGGFGHGGYNQGHGGYGHGQGHGFGHGHGHNQGHGHGHGHGHGRF